MGIASQVYRRLWTGICVALGSFIATQTLYVVFTYLRKVEKVRNFVSDFPWLFYTVALLVTSYLIYRAVVFLFRAFRSGRLDLFILVFLGIGFSVYVDAKKLGLPHLSLKYVAGACFFVVAHLIIYAYILRRRLKITENKSKFLSDNTDSIVLAEDNLGIKESAQNFAEQVINNFSSESLVFGLDAPWGAGKTTYLSFARESWKKYGDKVIIFDFNPQGFDIDTNLFDKFVDEFSKTLKVNYFVPEIQANLLNYLKFLKDSHFDFKFLQLSLPTIGKESNPLVELKESLRFFGRKVIVVIDDLDRLPIEDIKIILNIVKKSFVLPNVSYILCYDTENINALENKLIQTRSTVKLNNVPTSGDKSVSLSGRLSTVPVADNSKISEFFEKVVNIKISLFPNPEKLKEFLFAGLKQIGIPDSSIKSLATDSFNVIFHADSYYIYRPFIGDLRKIKRFLNTLVLLNRFGEIDFSTYDYNGKDLINLILIYINYPHVFRKIYDTEANGGKGFFSAVSPYDVFISGRNDKNFSNSEKYFNYLDTLNENERNLVEQIFTVKTRLENLDFSSIDPQTMKTFACFNGAMGTGRNLDAYLSIIIDGKLPPKSENYKFYLGKISELKNRPTLEEVIDSDAEFDLSKGEKAHISLYQAISEAPRDVLEAKDVQKVIKYILNHVQDYSLIHNNELTTDGYRDDLSYKIIQLLDRGGWLDEEGKTVNNSPKNLKRIADWIFGEGTFKKQEGIISILSNPAHGVLGLYDLILFRLFCSHDRQGSIYNVYTALGMHANENAKTEGLIVDLAVEEMREISQETFKIFKDRYITPRKNLIKGVQMTSLEDLMGKTYPVFEALSAEDKLETEKVAERTRNKVISFIIYQLSNGIINSGVGCGYYDPEGKADQKGIRSEMNKYLFDVVFNLNLDADNAEIFIDYVMLNFSKVFGENRGYKLLKDELEVPLDFKLLSDYWINNNVAIRKKLAGKSKTVRTMNYDLDYAKNLNDVYKELDKIAGLSSK